MKEYTTTLFKSIINNRFLFSKVIYHVHSTCFKYHCRIRCHEVEYINWLIANKRYGAIETRLNRYQDHPFASPICNESLCLLAADREYGHALLIKLLTHTSTILNNTIISSRLLAAIIKANSKDQSKSPDIQTIVVGEEEDEKKQNVLERELIDLLLSKSPSIVLDSIAYVAAAEHDRLDIIQLLLKRYQVGIEQGIISPKSFVLGSLVVDAAVKAGNLKILQFLDTIEGLYGVRVYFKNNTIDNACAYGKMDCLKWLLENKSDLGCTPNAVQDAAFNGNLDTIKLLWEYRDKLVKFYNDETTSNVCGGVGCTHLAVQNALKVNRIDILEFLFQNQLIQPSQCMDNTDLVLYSCATKNNQESIDCLRYMLETVKCKIDLYYSTIAAAKVGNIKVIQYLSDSKNIKHLHGKQIDKKIAESIVLAALEEGQIKLLQYIVEDDGKLGKLGLNSTLMLKRVALPLFYPPVFKDEIIGFLFTHLKFTRDMITSALLKHSMRYIMFLSHPTALKILMERDLINIKYITPVVNEMASFHFKSLQLIESHPKLEPLLKYQDILDKAAGTGNHEIVEYIHKKYGLELTPIGIEGAFRTLSIESLYYIANNMPGVRIPSNAIYTISSTKSFKLIYAFIKRIVGENNTKATMKEILSHLCNNLKGILYYCTGGMDILEALHDSLYSTLEVKKRPDILRIQQHQQNPDFIAFFIRHFHWDDEMIVKESLIWQYGMGSCESWTSIFYLLDIVEHSSVFQKDAQNIVLELFKLCVKANSIQHLDRLTNRFKPYINDHVYDQVLSTSEHYGMRSIHNFLRVHIAFTNLK